MTPFLGANLPYDPNTEHALLGALLVAPGLVGRAVGDRGLDLDAFHDTPARRVAAGLLAAHDAGHICEPNTVAAHMPDGPCLAFDLVQDMLVRAANTHAVDGLTDVLLDLRRRRRLAEAGRLLTDAAGTGDESLIAKAEAILNGGESADSDTADRQQLADIGYAYLDADTGRSPAVTTGFPALDERLAGGLWPGDTTALGGWTNMGKSPLCDQLLRTAALEGKRCHLYINEMNFQLRVLRLAAHASGVSINKLINRTMDPAESSLVVDALERLPFGMTDVSAWSPTRIARHIRSSRWDVCALDLLHNLPYRDTSELDQIISLLVGAARSSGTHLLLVCHLNEERAKTDVLPEPVIRDVRGSGMIKNACANVMFVHRKQVAQGGAVFTSTEAKLIISKSRHGVPGKVAAEFKGELMRFTPPKPNLKAVS